MRVRTLVCVAFVALSLPSCTKVKEAEPAPVGGAVAFVSEPRWIIDGPDESLWVTTRGGEMLKVESLAPDNEACASMTWDKDGRRVVFLIVASDGIRVTGFDVLERRHVVRGEITKGAGDSRQVVNLEWLTDGIGLKFDLCAPSGGECEHRTLSGA